MKSIHEGWKNKNEFYLDFIDDYIVIFRINEADKTVYVVTIQYQGRNI